MIHLPYVLSIGLNVGAAEPREQLTRTLEAVCLRGRVLAIGQGRSEWEGVAERFIHVAMVPHVPVARVAETLARVLGQDAIAVWRAPAPAWLLIHPGGRVKLGASLTEFPILKEVMSVFPMTDTIGHSSIQPWSAGPFFPAVIARLENAGEYAGHQLTVGAFSEVYASYDDAHAVATWVCQGGRIIPERYARLTGARS